MDLFIKRNHFEELTGVFNPQKRFKGINSIEEMELDFVNDISINQTNVKDSINETNEDRVSHIPQLKDITNVIYSLESNLSDTLASSETSDDFSLKKNELFHFLKSSLKGRIILGKYQKTKSVDYAMLKELIIYDKISEDPCRYKIESKTFIDLRNQIVELFPTEDPDCIHIPSSQGKENESVGARGCLYNYYKIVRKEIRNAGILTEPEMHKELSHEKIKIYLCIYV